MIDYLLYQLEEKLQFCMNIYTVILLTIIQGASLLYVLVMAQQWIWFLPCLKSDLENLVINEY